jgi:hypothetical protein
MLRNVADQAELTGSTMCVAAGNERCDDRPPNMLASPGDVPPPWISPAQPLIGSPSGVTTVGATRFQLDAITDFSNPGPSDWSQVPPYSDWWICDPADPGVGLIKPDVCAPGENINSTLMGGGYSGNNWSGTSMATPHVAGLAALLLSKDSDLSSEDVDRILETTAIDLGRAGKDNDYGSGRINAPAAIAATPVGVGASLVLVLHQVDDAVPGDGDGRLDPGETANLVLTLQNNGSNALGDVTGVLAASAGVTIVEGVSAFGAIGVPAGTGTNAGDPFVVQVAPGAQGGQAVAFTMAVSTDRGCTVISWNETIDGPAGTAVPDRVAGAAAVTGAPNPFVESMTFTIAGFESGRVDIFDVAGRRVRGFELGSGDRNRRFLAWDGRDELGHHVASGVYQVRVTRGAQRTRTRVLKLH